MVKQNSNLISWVKLRTPYLFTRQISDSFIPLNELLKRCILLIRRISKSQKIFFKAELLLGSTDTKYN